MNSDTRAVLEYEGIDTRAVLEVHRIGSLNIENPNTPLIVCVCGGGGGGGRGRVYE